MTSSHVGVLNENKKVKVIISDLQSLLSKILDEDTKIVTYETSHLVPKGENYSSAVLKVDVILHKNKNSLEEKLSLVAKTLIPAISLKSVKLDNDGLFRREIFVFEKVIPTCRELMIEADVEENGLINIFPKYFGGRLSLNRQPGASADVDAVILLENLKEQGYRVMDRLKGLNLEHAKLAISKLAHFHALTVALKQKRAKIFAEAKELTKKLPYVYTGEDFTNVRNFTVNLVCQDSRIAKYKDRLENSVKTQTHFYPTTDEEYVEHWVGITHGDFWINNIMFHEENGKAVDVKFIDYQVIQVNSLIFDLPYFIFCSCHAEVVENNFEQLLDVYYVELIEMLQKIKYDSARFTKESFNDEINRIFKDRLLQCLIGLKYFILNRGNVFINHSDETIKIFYERVWTAVSKFLEKKWF